MNFIIIHGLKHISLLINAAIVAVFISLIVILPVFSEPNFSDFSKIETQLFNKNFGNENMDSRLNRVESAVFGKTFNDNSEVRISRINDFIGSGGNISANSQTVNRNSTSKDKEQDNSATDYPSVTLMEMKVFNQQFTQENIYSRLNRLESKIFGTISSDSSLSDRVSKLQKALNINNNVNHDDDDDSSYNNNSSIDSQLSQDERKFNNQPAKTINIESDGVENFNDSFFDDKPQTSQSQTSQPQTAGLMNFVQSVVLPVLMGVWGNKNQYAAPQYYPYYPRHGYYVPQNPYYTNGIYQPPQNPYYNNYYGTPGGYIDQSGVGNTGLGVQILP